MGKIIFYEDRNFQGRSYECMNDCPELFSFLSRCQSCRVDNGWFVIYDRPNYIGNQYFLRRGEYADYSNFGMSDSIQSCRLAPQYRGAYRIRIYERENFQGQNFELADDCDNFMDRFRLTDWQSFQVLDGYWLMYEQAHFRGRMFYLYPGEYRSMRSLGCSGMRFNSFKRITDSC